jgi:hypothetical protein
MPARVDDWEKRIVFLRKGQEITSCMQKAWFHCSKGLHDDFEARVTTVYRAVTKHSPANGCLGCAKRAEVTADKLEKVIPFLRKGQDLTNSHKKVWFHCSKGLHSDFEATISSVKRSIKKEVNGCQGCRFTTLEIPEIVAPEIMARLLSAGINSRPKFLLA